MASQAVFLHDGHGSGGQFDGLRFKAECENGGVSQTVFGLERILANQRRMGNVAIVARYIPTVRGMRMGNVGIRHDVTVHARFRRIDHVRCHTGDVGQEQSHPAKATQEDHRGNSKFRADKAQPRNHDGEDKCISNHLNHTMEFSGAIQKNQAPAGVNSGRKPEKNKNPAVTQEYTETHIPELVEKSNTMLCGSLFCRRQSVIPPAG